MKQKEKKRRVRLDTRTRVVTTTYRHTTYKFTEAAAMIVVVRSLLVINNRQKRRRSSSFSIVGNMMSSSSRYSSNNNSSSCWKDVQQPSGPGSSCNPCTMLPAPSTSSSTTPLRIVSWNILGDGLKLALSTKHEYCPRHLRLWHPCSSVDTTTTTTTTTTIRSRCERTAQNLLSLKADIFCLQECFPKMFDDLTNHLQGEFIGFHMKDHLVPSIQDFLSNDTTIDTNNNNTTVSATTTTTTTGQEEYGNAIFLRRSLISDGIIELRWVKSGLFQTIGPQLNSTASSKVTGKARKRFLTLDCYGFLVMKLRIMPTTTMLQTHKPNNTSLNVSNISHTSQPIDAFIIGTHLYWNPWDPQVKALQAEVLAQLSNICAHGKLPTPPSNTPSSLRKGSLLPSRDTKTIPNFVKASTNSNSNTNTSHGNKNNRSTIEEKNPCVVIIGGDFNSVPHFQPEFISTKEELQALTALCSKQGDICSSTCTLQPISLYVDTSERVNIQVERLPLSFQQSGVFRLLTYGLLEPNHPEHPDTYGRGGANTTTRRRKMHVCGTMYTDPFAVDSSPDGFQMAYAYPHEPLDRNNGVKLSNQRMSDDDTSNAWPALTTKVPEFEGVIDYIFWKFLPGKSSTRAFNGKQMKLRLNQTEVLRVPRLNGPIPDETHTSDHLPVGMGFCICANFD